MSQNTDRSQLITNRLFECVESGEVNLSNQIQIFEQLKDYLNLKSIQKYSDENNISYNGTLLRINTNKLLTTNIEEKIYIIDND